VGQSLKETFRKHDFIARYGGDEFAVVIEGLSVEMAQERIMQFEENFRKKRFLSQKNGDIKVGISAGVSPAKPGETPENLINRADEAMYALKQKRKNA
jgi:diguanylate cyclase